MNEWTNKCMKEQQQKQINKQTNKKNMQINKYKLINK